VKVSESAKRTISPAGGTSGCGFMREAQLLRLSTPTLITVRPRAITLNASLHRHDAFDLPRIPVTLKARRRNVMES